jgi:ABC-type antimicrobial peptide transport system permease subunit
MDSDPTVASATTTMNSLRDSVHPIRRHVGDDASCLNLYQSLRPTLLGVPRSLIARGGFKFSAALATTPEEKANPWLLLTKPTDDGAIPVIGEQNSILYMLKKSVGDTIEMPDASGAMKKLRIVASLQDSVFQSELLISDASFQKLYPRDEGFADFLIETSPAEETSVRRVLETGLSSHGMIVTASRDRVASYQAVVGTYLTTFQLLGGLGLLLGVLGLAAIVLRGVWDRIGEFALLSAVGYSPRDVRTLVLAENLLLLVLGVGLGLVTAIVSVLPQGGELIAQFLRLAALLGIVVVVGVVTVVIATRTALKTPLLSALRSE